MRRAIVSRWSRGAESTRRLRKLKRTARTPSTCRRSSSESGDIVPDARHAPGAAAGRRDGVEHRAVVRAVATRLDNDLAFDTEAVAEGEQLFLRCIAWRVLALGCEPEPVARAKYVAVRVDTFGRQHEGRRRRARVPVKPSGRLREAGHGCGSTTSKQRPRRRPSRSWPRPMRTAPPGMSPRTSFQSAEYIPTPSGPRGSSHLELGHDTGRGRTRSRRQWRVVCHVMPRRHDDPTSRSEPVPP